MCKYTISLIAEMPLIYKVPVGIANLGGTDEAENIVTIMAMVIMTRERLREHDY